VITLIRDDFVELPHKDGVRHVRRDQIVGIYCDASRDKFFTIVLPNDKFAVVGMTLEQLTELIFGSAKIQE
jgi:hypothetical protein